MFFGPNFSGFTPSSAAQTGIPTRSSLRCEDGKRLRINAVQTLCAGFVGEALGHALKQAAPAMVRINNGLAALGNLCSRLPSQSNMTDDISPRVTSNYRNQLSALDLGPIPSWRHFPTINPARAPSDRCVCP